jgi:uncharacterized membrane protein (UPF0127 family)
MNGPDMGIAVFLAIILIVIFYLIYSFTIVKNATKKLSITNPDGSKVGLNAEIADNPIKMMKGLMGRKALGQDAGMLFVFPSEDIQPFWMFNTTIALDAIFIKSDGTVAEIIQMEPCGLNITKCRSYTPKASAKYVLEVNKGFSEMYGLVVGKSKMSIEGAN